jgi:uncharacterized protein YcbX
MRAIVDSLYRHPVKGFTPEPLQQADLVAGSCFPCDRLFAVEDGPSGFDPAAPAHISKQKFTVLAKMAEVAKVSTRYMDDVEVLAAICDPHKPFAGDLKTQEGRQGFAAWLTGVLGEAVTGPLRVIEGPGAHRFMDHPMGHVSIINLASVRDLAAKIGRPIDPLRFRANLYAEGWDAWVENDWAGRTLSLGGARATVYKPIVRCAATGVDPVTAMRDIDITAALFEHYAHLLCGIYVNVTESGPIALGDTLELLPVAEATAGN